MCLARFNLSGGYLSQQVGDGANKPAAGFSFYSSDVSSSCTGKIADNSKINVYFAKYNPGSSSLTFGAGVEVYGYKSEVYDNPSNYKAYQFYAGGNAESYFAGSIRITQTPGANPNQTANGCMVSTTSGLSVSRTTDSSSNSAASFTLHTTAAGNAYDTDYRILTFRDEGGNRATIRFNSGGQVVLSGISDYRAKENIVDLTPASDIIKGLRVRQFNFKGSPTSVVGFVAHEVQEFIPQAVGGTKDATETYGTYTSPEGVVETEVSEPEAVPFGATFEPVGTRDVYQDLATSELIPFLTKALQEALGEIDNLKNALQPWKGLDSNTLNPFPGTMAINFPNNRDQLDHPAFWAAAGRRRIYRCGRPGLGTQDQVSGP